MENFISDVKFRGFSSKVPSTMEKVQSYLHQGQGEGHCPQFPLHMKIQSSPASGQLSSCSQLHSMACWFCTDLSPAAVERKEVCAEASAGHGARDREGIRSTREGLCRDFILPRLCVPAVALPSSQIIQFFFRLD